MSVKERERRNHSSRLGRIRSASLHAIGYGLVFFFIVGFFFLEGSVHGLIAAAQHEHKHKYIHTDTDTDTHARALHDMSLPQMLVFVLEFHVCVCVRSRAWFASRDTSRKRLFFSAVDHSHHFSRGAELCQRFVFHTLTLAATQRHRRMYIHTCGGLNSVRTFLADYLKEQHSCSHTDFFLPIVSATFESVSLFRTGDVYQHPKPFVLLCLRNTVYL